MSRVPKSEQSFSEQIAEFYSDNTTFERKQELDAEFVDLGLLHFAYRRNFAHIYENLPAPFNHFTGDNSYDGKWWFHVEDDEDVAPTAASDGANSVEDANSDEVDHRNPMLMAICSEQPDQIYSIPIKIWGSNPYDFFCRMQINQIKQVIVFVDYYGVSVYNFKLEPIFRLANTIEMNSINCIWGAELSDDNQLLVWKVYDQEFSEGKPKYKYNDSANVAPNDRIIYQLDI
jgi:hypothetical protein